MVGEARIITTKAVKADEPDEEDWKERGAHTCAGDEDI